MTATQGSTASFPLDAPDIKLSVRQTFGIDSDMEVPAFSMGEEHVPDVDEAYQFDHDTTLAVLAGFIVLRMITTRKMRQLIQTAAHVQE